MLTASVLWYAHAEQQLNEIITSKKNLTKLLFFRS